MGEDDYLFKTDVYIQKHGYRTGLDTLVVHAVTDECLKLKPLKLFVLISSFKG